MRTTNYKTNNLCLFFLFVFFYILTNLVFTMTTWGSEPRPNVGVRALGMAGAFTGRADDPTAALWNPAGLARLQHKSAIVYDLSQGALSFAYPIRRVGTFGLSILDLNYKDRFIYDESYNPVGKFEIGYNQMTLSYARSINRLMIGVNFTYSKIPWKDSNWQHSFDAGMVTSVAPDLFIGLRVIDIAGTKFYNSEGEIIKKFYQQVSVGTSWTPSKHLSFNSDFDTAKWKIRIGTEMGYKGIYLRSGAIVNLINSEMPFGWTAGGSINLGNSQLNYAYLNDSGVDYKHLVSLGFAFGGSKVNKPQMPGPLTGRESQIHIQPSSQTQSRRQLYMPKDAKTESTMKENGVTIPKIHKIVPSPISGVPTIQNTQEASKDDISNLQILIEKPVTPESQGNDNNTEDSKPLIAKLVEQYNIELSFILAVIEIESKFKPDNISKAGAVGLMQLMPQTARGLGLRVPMYKNILKPIPSPKLDERFDPRKNVEAGMRYLSRMVDKYDKNYVLALCAYNAGSARVDKDIPRIRETERHVGRVLSRYYEYKNSPQERRNALEKLNAILGE